MRDLSGLPPVVTRRMMPPWALTREHLESAPRGGLERLARHLGFARPEGWELRVLVRRLWRVLRPDRKQVVKEGHLLRARREDLERLARFVGVEPRARWSHEELASKVWPKVDARRGGS